MILSKGFAEIDMAGMKAASHVLPMYHATGIFQNSFCVSLFISDSTLSKSTMHLLQIPGYNWLHHISVQASISPSCHNTRIDDEGRNGYQGRCDIHSASFYLGEPLVAGIPQGLTYFPKSRGLATPNCSRA